MPHRFICPRSSVAGSPRMTALLRVRSSVVRDQRTRHPLFLEHRLHVAIDRVAVHALGQSKRPVRPGPGARPAPGATGRTSSGSTSRLTTPRGSEILRGHGVAQQAEFVELVERKKPREEVRVASVGSQSAAGEDVACTHRYSGRHDEVTHQRTTSRRRLRYRYCAHDRLLDLPQRPIHGVEVAGRPIPGSRGRQRSGLVAPREM